jgi:hypothetical protein
MDDSAESSSLREEDIVRYLASVKNEVSNYLEKRLKERAISLEVYERVRLLNEEVAKKLLKDLGKVKPNEVHILESDRVNVWEFARIVIELIKESSHEREVIDFAHKIRKDYSLARGLPLNWSPENFCYGHLTVFGKPVKMEYSKIEVVLRMLDHYISVARAVEKKTRTLIKYAEEPDDIIRMAGRTLEIGLGDCDDFTVLIGSIWRALGFWVCIGVGPNHAFPAIILPSLEMIEEPEEKINQEKMDSSVKFMAIPTIVPADDIELNLSGKTFSCYDLLNFNSSFRQNLYIFMVQTFGSKKIENLLRIENNEKLKGNKQIRELHNFLRRLQYVSEGYTYYPVPPVSDPMLGQCHHLITLLLEVFNE